MSILVVAAESTELKPLAERLVGVRKLNWPIDYAFEGIAEGRRILLAANGAGPKLAAQAVEIATRAVSSLDLTSSRLEAVISAGYCGALDPALHHSQVVVATEVLDFATGERFSCVTPAFDAENVVSGVVLSQNRIANDTTEKQRLFAETGASAVEMEAAGVAARAKRAGLPFLCIKVITDVASESFPLDLNAMRTPEGRVARGKIVVHALAHPAMVPGLFRLRRRTELAAQALGDFLVSCRISSDVISPGGE